MFILCLDIGGTNPRLAMLEVQGFDQYEIKAVHDVDKTATSIIPEINKFLASVSRAGYTTNTCCVSVAGPVAGNASIKTMHAKFSVVGKEIQEKTACHNALVINDFQAIGEAVATIDTHKNDKLIKVPILVNGKQFFAPEEAHGTRVVVGPGTGLGMGYLINANGTYEVRPSEGGHGMIGAPTYLNKIYVHVQETMNLAAVYSEVFVSGKGIRRIMDYLLTKPKALSEIDNELHLLKDFKSKGVVSDKEFKDWFKKESTDPSIDVAKRISQHAYENEKAFATMRIFMEFTGMVCQSASLTFLPSGGLFIAGGVIPKNKDFLMMDDFSRGFLAHNAMKDIALRAPIYLIDDYDISFYGCARAAHTRFHEVMV
jgi:glucokinase